VVRVLFGALDDLVDMEGAFGGEEYVIYEIHTGLAFGFGGGTLAEFGAAQGAQGAELSEGGIFEDINEVIFV